MSCFIFLRSLVSVLVLFPAWTTFLSLLTIVNTLTFAHRGFNDLMISMWSHGTCWFFGVKIRSEGLGNLPPGGFLLLFNHRSYFDIFVIQALLPGIRFGAKQELFRIPIFGAAMRRSGALPIARGNVEEVRAVYEGAVPRLRAGERFALSPEGGRNTSADPLRPFKSGPFIFALSAGAPIVPVLVYGAEDVWPKGAIVPQTKKWRTEIVVRFLPAIEVKGYGLDGRRALKDKVYGVMRAELGLSH